MKDLDTKEMAVRIWINEKIKEVLDKYGFQLVEPSALENLETLQVQCGEDLKNEIYWFKDKSDREIGLRFDLTVGLTRMVANKPELPEPIKIACISNMWRYDEPQFARYRCFWQWDVEIYGSKEQEADAEVIAVGVDILENLGLKNFEVKINNRKLTEGVLNSIGVSSAKQLEDTLRIIDKIRKVSEGELIEDLAECGIAENTAKKIMQFMKISGRAEEVLKKLRKIIPDNQKAREGYGELVKLVETLKMLGKIEKCSLDMSIVRGIGYYTGIVFECYDKGGKDVGAIFAGGRFDDLSKLYGKDRPATGVAGGIERTIISLERAKIIPEFKISTKVFVAAVEDDVRRNAMEIAQKLRMKNIATEIDLKKRNLTKQLEYADGLGIPYVVIVGKNEIKKKKFKLRDMKKKIERELKIEEIIKLLQK